MKKITIIFAMTTAFLSFSQNQSSGVVQSSISPVSQILGSQEKFRFQSGLITQLDSGNDFNFINSRWFSMGSLSTPSQMVYGLRFQLPNRALTMGYQDFGDRNPRIQWIGDGAFSSTNLEFRVADSFGSTNSKLVASMGSNGNIGFGGGPFSNTKVRADFSNSSTGLDLSSFVQFDSDGFQSKTGIFIESIGDNVIIDNTGIFIELVNSTNATGIRSSVNGSSSGTVIGIESTIIGGSSNFGAAIYGEGLSTSPNVYAGFFDGKVGINGNTAINGNLIVSGTFTASDRKLKKEIKKEENILNKISQLNAVNYKLKVNNKINVSQNLQHGFIAQEVEEVFPELVTTVKKPIYKDKKLVEVYEYKAVNYVGLVSVLTSAVQELAARDSYMDSATYSDLTERIKSLENDIENLKAKNIDNSDGLSFDKTGFSMKQNVPNPFRNQTTVNYNLPNNTGNASIMVFDMSGKFVKSYKLTSNEGNVVINSIDLGKKGMFLYTLTVDNQEIITKRMIVN